MSTENRAIARASAWRITRSDSSSQLAGAAPALAPSECGVEFGRPEGWAHPLVVGEQPTSVQRLMTVADSASGVSTWLGPARWLFINAELTVRLQRTPVGEWIGLDARP